jgi:[ribosomal protein S18]-alanine N-acetyltransferase
MIRVRCAAATDVPQLMAIGRSAAAAAQWSQEQYEQMFSSDRVVLVAEDAEVLGFIAGRGIAGEWEIENVAVTEAARRSGLGSRLLAEFLHHIRCNSGREVFLEVRESNCAARAFYAKWGFIEAGRRKGYYHHPEEDALLLRHCLRQD